MRLPVAWMHMQKHRAAHRLAQAHAVRTESIGSSAYNAVQATTNPQLRQPATGVDHGLAC